MLNLTMHEATVDQVEAGVVEPSQKSDIKSLLVFIEIPVKDQVRLKALRLAEIAKAEIMAKGCAKKAMIGGAPYLMSHLEQELKAKGIQPFYAFSQRVSEEREVNGKVTKVNVFKHLGFYEA